MARRRWKSEEKIRMVMESLTTNITVADLCRKYSVSPVQFYRWRDMFIEAGKMGLTGRNGDAAKHLQKENESLKRIIGDLTMANDLFKKTLEGSKR